MTQHPEKQSREYNEKTHCRYGVSVCLTCEIDDIEMTFSIFWLLSCEVGVTVACFYRDDLRRTDELRGQDIMTTKAI